jgi:hypothetical protein
MRARGRDYIAAERGEHDHGRADALAAIFQRRGERIGVARGDRLTESIVSRDRLRRLRELPAIAFEQAREHQCAHVELPLDFAARTVAICCQHRAQGSRQHCRQQQQKSHGNSGSQRQRLSLPRLTRRLKVLG